MERNFRAGPKSLGTGYDFSPIDPPGILSLHWGNRSVFKAVHHSC
jgi:hypothetical protein